MLFNSFQFLFFFLFVTLVYFALPHRYRWMHLLIASCIFYCAFIPAYLLILLFTILVDYAAGILIERAPSRLKKRYLILSIVANLGVLCFFKYYNFFIENINTVIEAAGFTVHPLRYLSIILPIGLSFHTFQAMSYTLEVYRGKQKAERNLGIYSLYVMFYPQLVAGPIERPQHILPQLHEKKTLNPDEVVAGIKQMLWGLFKKVVVADQLSIYVNSVYGNWELNSGLTLILATYAFAFQIYGDFSGYSDIAQGSARVMGFRLMDNFHLPYFSKNVTEFWRRWHISLSSWLKDYLYIALGGNRISPLRTKINLFITMMLGGLWHGASWNFAIWGFLNGLYLSVEKMIKLPMPTRALSKVTMAFVTFNLIAITWVFFRAPTFADAMGVLRNLADFNNFWNVRIQDTGVFASMCFGLMVMLGIEYQLLRKTTAQRFFTLKSWARSLAWVITLTLLIVLFGVSEGDQFIYFQF